MVFDVDQLKNFPSLPGVYLMKDEGGKILYIGKANNLKTRLKQYFIPNRDGRLMVPFLTARVAHIDTIVVSSEKEALILENNLIKKHQPKYNALLKDDKTYFSLMVNYKHQWPMIRVVRYKGVPDPNHYYFGPYTHGHAARQTLEFLRHLFPLRQCSDRELINRTRPCILYELKRCMAPCVGKCSKNDYDVQVNRVVQFLRGQDKLIMKELKAEMKIAAEKLEFEKAEMFYKSILYIERTLEDQIVEKAGSADLDVLGIYRELDRVVLTQMLFRQGKLTASYDRLFIHNAQNDEELLSSFLLQHYIDQATLPSEIILPIDLKEKEALASLLSAEKKRKVVLLSPKKGNKKSLLEMAETNARSKWEREQKNKHIQEELLMSMEERFSLINYPERIECFDHSNISGSEMVSAMVVFSNGEKETKSYRKFTIRTAAASDDYGALKEVLTRRFRREKEKDDLPDLILVDGGKGHLNVACQVLSDLDISTVDVIAIAKEEGRHDKGMTAERIFLSSGSEIDLGARSPLLFLLQKIRDEAHRFAITFQRKRQSKKSLSSALDHLPGIGPVKKKHLLTHFGSWKRLVEAGPEQWRTVKGITEKDVETLKKSIIPKSSENLTD